MSDHVIPYIRDRTRDEPETDKQKSGDSMFSMLAPKPNKIDSFNSWDGFHDFLSKPMHDRKDETQAALLNPIPSRMSSVEPLENSARNPTPDALGMRNATPEVLNIRNTTPESFFGKHPSVLTRTEVSKSRYRPPVNPPVLPRTESAPARQENSPPPITDIKSTGLNRHLKDIDSREELFGSGHDLFKDEKRDGRVISGSTKESAKEFQSPPAILQQTGSDATLFNEEITNTSFLPHGELLMKKCPSNNSSGIGFDWSRQQDSFQSQGTPRLSRNTSNEMGSSSDTHKTPSCRKPTPNVSQAHTPRKAYNEGISFGSPASIGPSYSGQYSSLGATNSGESRSFATPAFPGLGGMGGGFEGGLGGGYGGGLGLGMGQDFLPMGDIKGIKPLAVPSVPSISSQRPRVPTPAVDNRLACPICHKVYATPASRTRHMRTHTDDRPYSCDVCGKKFRQNAHLKKHKRLHTGEKPYQCRYCEKKFTQKSTLTGHERTKHTKETPIGCPDCSARFPTRNHLRAHKSKCPGSKFPNGGLQTFNFA
ncbi:hypothetical protein AAMO2058_000590300 [Amorphochlora amoebiformis]